SALVSEDETLGIHWAIGGLIYGILICLIIYTQRQLLILRSQRVTLQMLGSINEVSMWLGFMLLVEVMPVVRNGANASIPCAFVLAWSQLGVSFIISLYIKRTLEFTVKTARIILARHSLERITSLKAVRVLTPARIVQMLIGIFVFTFLFLFMNPENISLFSGEKEEPAVCEDNSRVYVGIFFIVWTLSFVVAGRVYQLYDPYRILDRILALDIVLVICAIFTLTTTKVSTSHAALIRWDTVAFIGLTSWYLESCLPLLLTRSKLKQAAIAKDNVNVSDENSLLNTLINPKLLDLYQQHVIQEWSPENLDFLKQSVLFRLTAMRGLRSCLRAKESSSPRVFNRALSTSLEAASRIYATFISLDAPKLVNLPGNILSDLRTTFEGKEFEKYLKNISHVSMNGSAVSSIKSTRRSSFNLPTPVRRSRFGDFRISVERNESDRDGTPRTKDPLEARDSKSPRTPAYRAPTRDFCTALAELASESDIAVDLYLSNNQIPTPKDKLEGDVKKPFDSWKIHNGSFKRLAEIMNIFEAARKDIFILMASDSHRRFRNREDIREIMGQMNEPESP
ncbi:hypothetical protein AAMO2058_000929600, partial [Amorphochlora amoebiformis]